MQAGEMNFSYRDLYPNLGTMETSTLANPEADDQDALNEETEVAEEAKQSEAKGRNVFLALLVLVGLIIFFGGGK